MIRSSIWLIGALLALAGTATAQGRHEFVIDPTSTLSYSGNLSIAFVGSGPLTPGSFNISGESAIDLTASSGVLTAGQMVQGNSRVIIPDFTAAHPASGATLAIKGVELFFISTDASGNPAQFLNPGSGFDTYAVAEFTAGNAIFSVAPIPVPLAGETSPPELIQNATIVSRTDGFRATVPVKTTINYSDFLVTLSLTLEGTIVADDKPLAADVEELFWLSPGTQTLTLSAGTAHAGEIYWIVGSYTGTSPGVPFKGHQLPLNPDGYTNFTFFNPFFGFFGTQSIGTLDSLGMATATFTWPPLPLSLTFHHAFFTINSTATSVLFMSNPVPLELKM